MDLKPDELATNPFLVSLLGSLLGLKAWPGINMGEKALNVCLGFAIAIIAGPAIAEYTGVSSPRLTAAITFASGATGLVVFAAIIEGMRQTKLGDIITNWLSRRAGKDTPS